MFQLPQWLQLVNPPLLTFFLSSGTSLLPPQHFLGSLPKLFVPKPLCQGLIQGNPKLRHQPSLSLQHGFLESRCHAGHWSDPPGV